ncbi:hypothetical protein DL764_007044 [Monosporascus ibericus]|uniref:Uncharacterized protein n=1 Tax=Monosporascus ibericus TaxID=155417 RepID=A0A4V1X9W6_9PEZI|nr:hypothetical protein DL764_007044 [Monosporascus ibericus]
MNRQLELVIDDLGKRKTEAEAARAVAAEKRVELEEMLKSVLSVTSRMQIGTDTSAGQSAVLQPPSVSNSGTTSPTSSVPAPAGLSRPPSGPSAGQSAVHQPPLSNSGTRSPTSSVPAPAGPSRPSSGPPSGLSGGQSAVPQSPVSIIKLFAC